MGGRAENPDVGAVLKGWDPGIADLLNAICDLLGKLT